MLKHYLTWPDYSRIIILNNQK